MRDVPCVSGREQYIHEEFQHRGAGSTRAARVDFLHDIRYRFPPSQIGIAGRSADILSAQPATLALSFREQ